MKKMVLLVFVFLLFSTAVIVGFVSLAVAEGTIYIRSDGSVEGTNKIQRDRDVYTFTANIYDSIVVERDNIVVDGGGYTLQGTGTGNGIDLSGRKNVTVKNFEINKFDTGIYIDVRYHLPCNNTISGNSITNNNYGIYLKTSNDNIISGNNLTNNDYGIFLVASHFNVFKNNRMVDNQQNLIVHGGDPADLTQHMDTSNTVNGKSVYYWVEERDKTVPSDAGYVALTGCTNITVQNLNLTNNGQGILLASTTDSTITKNTITNNGQGIYLWDSSNNIISENILTNNNRGIHILGTYPTYSPNNRIYGNNIANNNESGILIADSSNNMIYGNDIANNGIGIYVDWASNNNVYHNNFINNTADVPGGWHYIGPAAHPVWMPPPGNVWDDSKEGNYWSNYVTRYPNATEIDGSGIWDTPYVISENNQDNYPLMKPVNISGVEIQPILEVTDTTPLTISIVSPENKTYTTNNVSLTFTVSEPTSWIGYSLDGQANVTVTGNTTLSGLSDGSHSLTVCAKDTDGNTGTSETIHFTIAQQSEPFPTWIVAAIVIIAVVGAALLIYFAKIKKTTGEVEK